MPFFIAARFKRNFLDTDNRWKEVLCRVPGRIIRQSDLGNMVRRICKCTNIWRMKPVMYWILAETPNAGKSWVSARILSQVLLGFQEDRRIFEEIIEQHPEPEGGSGKGEHGGNDGEPAEMPPSEAE